MIQGTHGTKQIPLSLFIKWNIVLMHVFKFKANLFSYYPRKSFIQIDDLTSNDQVSNLRVIDIKVDATGES